MKLKGDRKMKKFIKRTAMTLTVLLALFGITTGVAFASGYITWNGSSDYFQLIENLDLISHRGHEMKSHNENNNSELEPPNNRLLDKENEINALEQEIDALKKRAEGNKTTQDQLKQAEKDMKEAKKKSDEVLGVFN